jgi:predicted ATPase/DNA-binding winged helix-turn-helix (wHTH) protein
MPTKTNKDAWLPVAHERRPSGIEREYRFGPFRYMPARQRLLCGDTQVRVGGRALDILAVLLEYPGEIVSKSELIKRVWPRTVVEDSNLKVQLSALRRALGEGEDGKSYVVTVNRRGYRFVAPVTYRLTSKSDAVLMLSARSDADSGDHLPVSPVKAIGRREAIESLAGILALRRVATIVGPGGVGKTTVALAAGEALAEQQSARLCYVDLGEVAGHAGGTAALAGALGIADREGDAMAAVLATLRRLPALLILDSCERVLDAAAVLVELISVNAPGTSILATSREALRIPGEYVYRLPPLAVPPQQASLSALEAMAFPAVRLFAERAAECVEGYQLSDADAPAVAEICRRLDGMPMAIELAAIRMDALGACELAARLDERFRLLGRGRRSIHARHRTLVATLDWSYALLPADEQRILRGLAVFGGAFTLDAALALFADSGLDASQVVDGVANLVEKSLLSADLGETIVRYRLLATTRACAIDKLEASGEAQSIRWRHAELQYGALNLAAQAEWHAHEYGTEHVLPG